MSQRRLAAVAHQLRTGRGAERPQATTSTSTVAADEIPAAFLPETVAANSGKEQWLFREFHTNREPQASLYRLNMTTHKDPETGGINPDNPDHWCKHNIDFRPEAPNGILEKDLAPFP